MQNQGHATKSRRLNLIPLCYYVLALSLIAVGLYLAYPPAALFVPGALLWIDLQRGA